MYILYMVHTSLVFNTWQAILLILLVIPMSYVVVYRHSRTVYLVTEGLERTIKRRGRYSGVRICFNSECYGSEKLACSRGLCIPEVNLLEATPSIRKIHMSLPGAEFVGEAILSARMLRIEGMLYRSGRLYVLFPHPDNPRKIVRKLVYGPGRVTVTIGLGTRAGQAHLLGCSKYNVLIVLETAREKNVKTLSLTCTKTGERGIYILEAR